MIVGARCRQPAGFDDVIVNIDDVTQSFDEPLKGVNAVLRRRGPVGRQRAAVGGANYHIRRWAGIALRGVVT